MWNKIEGLCEDVFEALVDRLLTSDHVELMLITGPDVAGYIEKVNVKVAAACAAREWFIENGPAWAPRPLPLATVECDRLRSTLLGLMTVLYSTSLRRLDFNFRLHPPLQDYSCGLVMAYGTAEERDDPVLQQILPAKVLPGLDGVIWRPPAQGVAL